MSVRGGCLCGSVEFEADLPFSKFVRCHCSRCRSATGSTFAQTHTSCRARSAGCQARTKWLVSIFRLPAASRLRSAEIAAAHFHTPLEAAEKLSFLQGRFATTPEYRLHSTRAGNHARSGFPTSSIFRLRIDPGSVPKREGRPANRCPKPNNRACAASPDPGAMGESVGRGPDAREAVTGDGCLRKRMPPRFSGGRSLGEAVSPLRSAAPPPCPIGSSSAMPRSRWRAPP